MLWLVQTAGRDQTLPLGQRSTADRVIKQEVYVFGRIAGAGEQLDHGMCAPEQRATQPAGSALQRFKSGSPSSNVPLVRAPRIERLVVSAHERHLAQRQPRAVGITRAGQIHFQRSATPETGQEGIPAMEKLGWQIATLDAPGQLIDIVEIARIQQPSQLKQGDPHLDDNVAGKPHFQSGSERC